MGFGASSKLPEPFKPCSVEELRAAMMQRMLGVMPDLDYNTMRVSVIKWVDPAIRQYVINHTNIGKMTVEEGAKLWLDYLNKHYP